MRRIHGLVRRKAIPCPAARRSATHNARNRNQRATDVVLQGTFNPWFSGVPPQNTIHQSNDRAPDYPSDGGRSSCSGRVDGRLLESTRTEFPGGTGGPTECSAWPVCAGRMRNRMQCFAVLALHPARHLCLLSGYRPETLSLIFSRCSSRWPIRAWVCCSFCISPNSS